MIKSLLKDDINAVPFVVSRPWHATSKSNTSILHILSDFEYDIEEVRSFVSESLTGSFVSESSDLFIGEYVSSSVAAFSQKNLAIEFTDHGDGWQLGCSSASFISNKVPYDGPVNGLNLSMDVPFVNSDCDLCIEQSEDNFITIEEGIFTDNSIGFDPQIEHQNLNDTFKRITYGQIKNLFYNNSQDPTKLLGLENFDLFLNSTDRIIYDKIKVVTIPQAYFGDTLVKNSIEILNNSGDQSYTIVDDGNGNLYSKDKVFSFIKNDENKETKYYNTASVIKENKGNIQVNESNVNSAINWISYNDNIIYVHRSIADSFFVYAYDRQNVVNSDAASSNLIYLGPSGSLNQNVRSAIPHSKLFGYLKKIECGNDFVVALTSKGKVVTWGTSSLTSAPDFNENIKDISVGHKHAIALGESGTIYTWGDSNFTGNIPNFLPNDYRYIKAGPSGSIVIHNNNKIYGFGNSACSLLQNIPQITNVNKISFGEKHGMILDSDGILYSWSTDSAYSQSLIPNGYSNQIINVECGDNHTIVLNSNKTVACWGKNAHSQSSVPFGTSLIGGALIPYRRKIGIRDFDIYAKWETAVAPGGSYASAGLSDISNIFAKGDRSGVSKRRVLLSSDSESSRFYFTWGIHPLVVQYKVAAFSIGRDYNMIDLNSLYQKLIYKLTYNSPIMLKGTCENNKFSAGTFDINFINNNEYNLDKFFVKIPTDLSKHGDIISDGIISSGSIETRAFAECEFFIKKINNGEKHSHISTSSMEMLTGLNDIYLNSPTAESLNSNHAYIGSIVYVTRLTSSISYGTTGSRDYNNVMVGKFQSYDADTKLLKVDVTELIGEGTFNKWAIDFDRISVEELISDLNLSNNIYGRFYTSGSYETSSNYSSIRSDESFVTTYVKTIQSYDRYY